MSRSGSSNSADPVLLSEAGESGSLEPCQNNLDSFSPRPDTTLRAIIQRMSEPVMLVGRDHRVLEINDAALEVTGLPRRTRDLILNADVDPGRVTDQNGRTLTWEDSPQARALRGETVMDQVQVLHRKDGTIRYYIANGYPIRNEDGEVAMALVIGRDVTSIAERLIRAEEMLESMIREEKTLRTVLDNLPAAVMVVDSKLRLLSWNAAITRGSACARWRVGTRLERVIPRAQECGMVSLLRQALETGQAVRVQEFPYAAADGQVTYWTGSAVPIELELGSGTVHAVAVVAVDVTEEVAARQRMAELATLAEQRATEIETERARLDTIIESAPVPLCVLDTRGHTVSYNSAQRKLLESFGMDGWLLDGADPNTMPRFAMWDQEGHVVEGENCPAARALRGETCRDVLISTHVGGGPTRSFRVNTAPLRDASGEIVGVVQTSLEVTDLVRAQQHIQDLYQRERAVAEKLQESFVVRDYPDIRGFERAALYRAAVHAYLVGGDFHDLFYLNDGRVGIVIGDVAGKGLKAAVYTAMTKYMLRAYALENPEPDLVLARLNEALSACTPTEVFVTLAYAVLDTETGQITYANAGHEPPVWVSRASGKASILNVTGRALALAHGSVYTSQTFDLQPGDLVAFFTDGITDAGSGDRRLGPERVIEVLEASASCSAFEMADALLNAAVSFAGGSLSDDAAVLVVKRLGEKER